MTLLIALPQILDTIFKTQQIDNSVENVNFLPSWLDKIDIKLQEIREMKDKDSS